jgi:uncharacterized protein (DUF2336 family)
MLDRQTRAPQEPKTRKPFGMPSQNVAARVRLGANPATAPDTLLALANDPVVTVRAAVAMNAGASGQVDHVLSRDGDERVRTLLARKLASLIPSLKLEERDRLQVQALATLSELVEDEAIRVRAAIADAVKDMPDVPYDIILRLARDSAISVCEPVIRLSPLLTTDDLLALLAASPSPVTAAAVAQRSGLPEAVSDAVAATADTAAIATLLSNGTAAIRESTLDALIARAVDRVEWHAPMVRRPVLTVRAARALSSIVTAQLLDELASRADLGPEVTGELRRRLDERLRNEIKTDMPDPNITQAMAEARRLNDEDRLDEEALIYAAQRGDARLATAMLAVASNVGVSVVERAATLRSSKGLVSLVWKAGFSMRAAIPLQALLARLGPEAILRPTSTGGFPLAADEMRWQIEFLARIGR